MWGRKEMREREGSKGEGNREGCVKGISTQQVVMVF